MILPKSSYWYGEFQLFSTNKFISKKVQTVAHAIMSLANHTARMKMSPTPNVSTKIWTSKKFAEIPVQISKFTCIIYLYIFDYYSCVFFQIIRLHPRVFLQRDPRWRFWRMLRRLSGRYGRMQHGMPMSRGFQKLFCIFPLLNSLCMTENSRSLGVQAIWV